ncbi:MAG: hypothetical protein IPP40_02940 [bacterium]|nr:hypothetical protein [bacterium]
MAVSAVKSQSFTTLEWAAGLAVAGVSLAAILAWLFWGDLHLQSRLSIGAVGGIIAMVRYLEIASFLMGFLLVANLGAFIPGSTSGFFAGVFLILLIRKQFAPD